MMIMVMVMVDCFHTYVLYSIYGKEDIWSWRLSWWWFMIGWQLTKKSTETEWWIMNDTIGALLFDTQDRSDCDGFVYFVHGLGAEWRKWPFYRLLQAFVTLGLVMGAFLLCWFPFFLWWIIIFCIIIRCCFIKSFFEMPISYSSCFAFFFKALTFNITFIFQAVNSYLLFQSAFFIRYVTNSS